MPYHVSIYYFVVIVYGQIIIDNVKSRQSTSENYTVTHTKVCPYCSYTYSFVQDHVESNAECHNKEKGNQCKLQKGRKNVLKHENIDAQQWQSLQEEDKVDPGEKDSNRSQLPLPASGTPAVGAKMAYKWDR